MALANDLSATSYYPTSWVKMGLISTQGPVALEPDPGFTNAWVPFGFPGHGPFAAIQDLNIIRIPDFSQFDAVHTSPAPKGVKMRGRLLSGGFETWLAETPNTNNPSGLPIENIVVADRWEG